MSNAVGPPAPILGDACVGSCEGSVEYQRVCSLTFSSPPNGADGGTEQQRRLLDAVGHDPVHHPVHSDSIGMKLGLPAAVVASHLSVLELSGHRRTVAGGLIVRA